MGEVLSDDFNVLAFNYDWRRLGDPVYNEQYRGRFQRGIENDFQATRMPMSLIGHSAGCMMILWCLSRLGATWTKTYISDVILVGPCVPGSPYGCGAYGNVPLKTPISMPQFFEDAIA